MQTVQADQRQFSNLQDNQDGSMKGGLLGNRCQSRTSEMLVHKSTA